ncbi:MAG: class I SAM-dependent methyltransferase [Gammaproteobacteria bacterium]|nr:class I SAM-dependent methyltransferase [Gammaproteobacteria bacterium]
MGESTTGQVSDAAARVYDAVYLPALFQQWCPRVVASAEISAGQEVIDVACGTGALALAASEAVGADGFVAGVDNNTGMLAVAATKSATVEWYHAGAESLPFEQDRFDRALCQFGLMYFKDRVGAIGEMMRVLRPDGRLVLVVWDELAHNPGLAAEEYLWQQVFDEEIDEAPYSLGNKSILEQLLRQAGISDFRIETHTGTARYDSIRSWIHTGAAGWTDDDALDADELELLLDTAERELAHFRTARGHVEFSTSAHIVTA